MERAIYEAIRRSGDTEPIVGLIRAGVSPNFRRAAGETCLHAAAYCGSLELVKELARKADVTVKDSHGNLAADLAAMQGNDEAVAFLQPLARSKKPHTIAAHQRHRRVLQEQTRKQQENEKGQQREQQHQLQQQALVQQQALARKASNKRLAIEINRAQIRQHEGSAAPALPSPSGPAGPPAKQPRLVSNAHAISVARTGGGDPSCHENDVS